MSALRGSDGAEVTGTVQQKCDCINYPVVVSDTCPVNAHRTEFSASLAETGDWERPQRSRTRPAKARVSRVIEDSDTTINERRASGCQTVFEVVYVDPDTATKVSFACVSDNQANRLKSILDAIDVTVDTP